VTEILRVQAQCEQLRLLDLYFKDSLGGFQQETSPISVDPDFDAARAIMQMLHSRKRGVPFEIVTIHTRHARNHPIYEDYVQRKFMSRLNPSGIYQQWGSEGGEGLRVEDI
jgi:hypothetical protein